VGKRAAKQREPPKETSAALAKEINDFFYLFGLGADVLGLPVVAGVSSGIHVMLDRNASNGPSGGFLCLIIYRHFARRFCRKRCKDLHLARLRQQAQESKGRWLAHAVGIHVSGPRRHAPCAIGNIPRYRPAAISTLQVVASGPCALARDMRTSLGELIC
jgi:hypothetical protein